MAHLTRPTAESEQVLRWIERSKQDRSLNFARAMAAGVRAEQEAERHAAGLPAPSRTPVVPARSKAARRRRILVIVAQVVFLIASLLPGSTGGIAGSVVPLCIGAVAVGAVIEATLAEREARS